MPKRGVIIRSVGAASCGGVLEVTRAFGNEPALLNIGCVLGVLDIFEHPCVVQFTCSTGRPMAGLPMQSGHPWRTDSSEDQQCGGGVSAMWSAA